MEALRIWGRRLCGPILPKMQDSSSRMIPMRLVADRDHYDHVMTAVLEAEHSIWIATANLKDVMVEPTGVLRARRGRRGTYRSVLDVFAELVARGVEIRLLHAGFPSRAFRRSFDANPTLVSGGLQMRTCPRVHLKMVVVDAAMAYLGSANWTGAGLGAKGDGRRNFEMGIVTHDDLVIDEVQARFDRIWQGAECGSCRLRDACEMPLDQI